MPTKYKRKNTTLRGNWTEEQLRNVIDAVKNKAMRLNKAAKTIGFPKTDDWVKCIDCETLAI